MCRLKLGNPGETGILNVVSGSGDLQISDNAKRTVFAFLPGAAIKNVVSFAAGEGSDVCRGVGVPELIVAADKGLRLTYTSAGLGTLVSIGAGLLRTGESGS